MAHAGARGIVWRGSSQFSFLLCVPRRNKVNERIGQRQGQKHTLLSGESGPLEVIDGANSHIATELVTKDGRFSDDEVTG